MNPYRADAQGDPDLAGMVRTLTAEALELLSLLEAISDVQWKRSEIPALPDEDEEKRRGKGGHADPVPPVVFDGRRLELRAAAIKAEREIIGSTQILAQTRRHLLRAAERWQGH